MAEPPKLEPEQLRQSPELAILEAADAVIDTALAALVAANPALLGPDPFERHFDDMPAPPRRLYAADALLTAAHALRTAITATALRTISSPAKPKSSSRRPSQRRVSRGQPRPPLPAEV